MALVLTKAKRELMREEASKVWMEMFNMCVLKVKRTKRYGVKKRR